MIHTIGLGTAAIGRPQYINIRQTEPKPFDMVSFRKDGLSLLDSAYKMGVRYYDTAPGYGIAEEILLDWVAQKADPSIEVATKWGYTYIANFDPNATEHEIKEHSLEKLNTQWERSKHLLPYLSTYQIHSATFSTGVLENQVVLDRLAQLKNEYNIRIGLTTTGYDQVEVLKKAMDICSGSTPLFDVFQVTYNIFDQSLANFKDQMKQWSSRFVIKEALANGRVFENDRFRHYQRAYDVLSRLASKYDVGIDAIALRFCLDSIPADIVLSGANNEEHLMSNLKANHFELEKADLIQLHTLAVDPALYWKERKNLDWN